MEKFLRIPTAVHLIISVILILTFDINIAGSPEYTLIARIGYFIYWLIYPYALVSVLALRLPKKNELHVGFYLFNWIYTFICLIGLALATYIYEQKEFHGMGAMPCVYLLFALPYVFILPARILKMIETGENVKYRECLSTFFLLIFMPFNFLFVHKRVIKALNNPIVRQNEN